MSRRIEFTVQGQLPPKKDGATSMWKKSSEHARLVALRTQAQTACGTDGPLSENIQLTLEIHCPRRELHSIGDLDNFITGICDGLMAAAKGTTARQRQTIGTRQSCCFGGYLLPPTRPSNPCSRCTGAHSRPRRTPSSSRGLPPPSTPTPTGITFAAPTCLPTRRGRSVTAVSLVLARRSGQTRIHRALGDRFYADRKRSPGGRRLRR